MGKTIVPAMPYKEMYDILMADFPKISYWAEKQMDKVIKELSSTNIFPAYRIIKYQSPVSNNHYFIYYYVEYAGLLNNPCVGHFMELIINKQRFLLVPQKGGFKPCMRDEIEEMPQVYVYSHHFFEQYNNRFLKNKSLSINEIACCFFSRNRLYEPIPIDERINKNIKKYNENANRGFKVRDGFCFTVYDLDVDDNVESITDQAKINAFLFLFTTFMNVGGLKDMQIRAILEESRKSWELLYSQTKWLKKTNGELNL